MGYLERITDGELALYLKIFGAVLIKGPKWCGKTTTAEKHSKSKIELQDPDKTEGYVSAADTNLSLILEGDNPRLIDEWQIIPQVWDSIRYLVDKNENTGLYILTGSRVPSEKSIMHCGAGRFGVLFMYPMSLYESGDSNGTVSLSELFSGTENVDGKKSNLDINQLAYCICRGGWPANIGKSYRVCSIKLKSYLDLIYESDDLSLKKYAKDVKTARSILRSYSRNISSLSSLETIYRDVSKNDGLTLSETKFLDYIMALRNVYLIMDVPAWNPSIRSKTAIRSKEKRELIDPSIAALYLGLTPDNYKEDFNTFGFLFECLCIRDLRVYASTLGGNVSYYHDRYNLEVDAVIKLDDGRYGLIEIKLGKTGIEEGAQNLCKVEKLALENGLKPPSFKMVLTGGEHAYKRKDGVCVIPIGCLKD